MNMKKLFKLAFPVALAFAALLFFTTSSQAVHKSGATGKFFCLACHNMHATKMWDTAAGGLRLLRHDRNANVCLQCHEEDQGGEAGKVETGETPPFVADATGTNGRPTTVGAGGYFYGLNTSTPSAWAGAQGHGLNLSAPSIPVGGAITGTFWCANCHDMHGTTNTADLAGVSGFQPLGAPGSYTVDTFRNLKRGAADITAVETSATDTNYRTGIADFCKQCHSAYTGASAGYHPVDTAIATAGMAGTWYESGMNDTLVLTAQPIIKPEDPLGTDNRIAAIIADRDPGAGDDEVTCLTCHYAHGGPYTYMLRWQRDGNAMLETDITDPTNDTLPTNFADMATAYGCQVCHNK